MRFTKWQGLGNDYIIVDAGALSGVLNRTATEALCDRHFGIGSDGVLVWEEPSVEAAAAGAIARMRIFNPDGSEPEMCGNGIRMFARYLRERGAVAEDEFLVETGAGLIGPSLMEDGRVRVRMGRVRFRSDSLAAEVAHGRSEVLEETLHADGEEYVFSFADVGNPHCIIRVAEPGTVDLSAVGPLLEHHPAFPNRANVEFVRPETDGSISMRVWERGVGETQACGTGATAVGAVGIRLGWSPNPVVVHLPGGDLEIEMLEEGEMVMTGPAEKTFTGTVAPPLLKRMGWLVIPTYKWTEEDK